MFSACSPSVFCPGLHPDYLHYVLWSDSIIICILFVCSPVLPVSTPVYNISSMQRVNTGTTTQAEDKPKQTPHPERLYIFCVLVCLCSLCVAVGADTVYYVLYFLNGWPLILSTIAGNADEETAYKPHRDEIRPQYKLYYHHSAGILCGYQCIIIGLLLILCGLCSLIVVCFRLDVITAFLDVTYYWTVTAWFTAIMDCFWRDNGTVYGILSAVFVVDVLFI